MSVSSAACRLRPRAQLTTCIQSVTLRAASSSETMPPDRLAVRIDFDAHAQLRRTSRSFYPAPIFALASWCSVTIRAALPAPAGRAVRPLPVNRGGLILGAVAGLLSRQRVLRWCCRLRDVLRGWLRPSVAFCKILRQPSNRRVPHPTAGGSQPGHPIRPALEHPPWSLRRRRDVCGRWQKGLVLSELGPGRPRTRCGRCGKVYMRMSRRG